MHLILQIIDAYIHCIIAKEHLQMRSGGSVFLENACISKMIKEFSSIRDDAPRWVLNRDKTYLENDMVSLSSIHITMNSIKDECLYMGPKLTKTLFSDIRSS